MKIALIGSRNFRNTHKIIEFISLLSKEHSIVSGGARGVDSFAEKVALQYGFGVTVYYPNWEKYGKRAGYLRNKEIVKNSDVVVAFWDRKSKGTKLTIDLAKEYNKFYFIIEDN